MEWRQYGRRERRRVKSFLATYPPAGGTIRVVILQEEKGCHFFFSSDRELSACQILEAMADRWAVEQTFRELKQVWGAGEQQLRDLWANIGAWHLHLWLYTLVELWAWNKPAEELCDRGAPPGTTLPVGLPMPIGGGRCGKQSWKRNFRPLSAVA